MLSLWRKSSLAVLTDGIKRKLAADRNIGADMAAGLRMMTERGNYVGRKVTFFRIFDPAILALAGIKPNHYSDLEGDAVLHAGFIENDGQVVLNRAFEAPIR